MTKPNRIPQFPLATASVLAIANTIIIGLSFSFVKIAVTLAGLVDTLTFRFVIALVVCFCGDLPRTSREQEGKQQRTFSLLIRSLLRSLLRVRFLALFCAFLHVWPGSRAAKPKSGRP